MVERLAFGESRNDDGDERSQEENPYTAQRNLILLFPEVRGKSFEELGYSEFSNPDTIRTL